MGYVTTSDGVEIFYKDWGPKNGKVIYFHHGWPLSSDDWDAQMLFFVNKGFRVVAHDRRGHGRSSQVSEGHDMDHYADDVAAVVKHWRAGRDARGPLDGRRRSGALYRAPRRGQSIQSGADQRGAAADGKNRRQSAGHPQSGVR